MARKATGNPTGRPKKHIDNEQFKKLCGFQCTKEEIASFFDVGESKIETYCKETYGETFQVVFKRLSVTGKICLRRYQFELAKRNSAMAIFLGKQILGQKDNVNIEGKNITENQKIEFVFTDTSINKDEDNDT